MKKGWTASKLTVTGSFGVIRFLVYLIFASIGFILGPLTIVFTIFFFSFTSVLNWLIVRQFGTTTLQTFVEYMLELPLPVFAIIKPAEFLVALVRSFIIDILFVLLKKSDKIIAIVCGGTYSLFIGILGYVAYLIIGLPSDSAIPAFILTIYGAIFVLLVLFLEGVIGGYLGYIVYQKIKKTAVVKRIQK